MNLIKYDNLWNDPSHNLDQWFERAFGSFANWPQFQGQSNSRSFNPTSLNVDVYDDDNNYYVLAELPGISKDDVDIQLENSVLSIQAEVKSGEEGKNEYQAKYSRSLTVSDDIDPEKIEAKLKDGLLTVTLPKSEARKPKSITIS